MNTTSQTTAEQVKAYCARIGADPLLVQGAGGNVSWKDGATLWVKASGTWLADAAHKDIFVPVDLAYLLESINQNDFSRTPKLMQASALKPSIETVLHALLPAKVVVHVHAIEVLAHLVRKTCSQTLRQLLGDSVNYVEVDYARPGAELAAAVKASLSKNPTANVIFLKNHGMVIGAESVDQIESVLNQIISKLGCEESCATDAALPDSHIASYLPVDDPELHRLATDPLLFSFVRKFWALYPDHVVFLGAAACTFPGWQEFSAGIASLEKPLDLVFVENAGVYTHGVVGKAKLVQLRCYYDVLVRQSSDAELNALTKEQILSLLDWDAEKYRIGVAQQ